MPVTESICIPVSNDLSFAETAIITKMASYPEADNCTAEKMHSMVHLGRYFSLHY